MTLTQEALLKKYAKLKTAIKETEAQIEELEPQVLAFLEKEGADTWKEPWGTYSVVYRKKWSYTPAVTEKEKEYKAIIKQKQQDEQESGEAKAEEVKGLSYREYAEK